MQAEQERQDADLSQAQLELESWSSKIEELANAFASDEKDLKEAENLRVKDSKVFIEAEKGLSSTVDALDRAVGLLGHEQRRATQGSALLQMEENGTPIVEALSAIVEAYGVKVDDQHQLQALLQGLRAETSEEEAEDAALNTAFGVEPATSKSRSRRLIGVLNEILEKAQGELEQLRRKEQRDLHNFELRKQSLADQMAFKKRDLAAAKGTRSEASQRKAASEKLLAAARSGIVQAAAALEDLQKSCLQKASKFEEETQARTEEVHALQEAKDAISSRMRGSLSFLQLQHQRFKTVPESFATAMAAARAVRRLAVRVDSPSLIELAGRLDYVAKDRFGSSADALNRVRGLIEDMIGRLQSEAHAEADHQAFCDKEMSVASVKRDDKQSDVDKLSTKMEEARSELTLLSQQSSRLRQELADLAQSSVELDKVRQEEKVLFEKAHKDTQEGLEGLRVALQVLRTFYAKIGGTGRSGHAVSTLEFAASEMRKRAMELEARESQAASEYTRITTDNGVMQASKQHEAEARTADVSALQKLLNELSSDHAAAKEELDALQDFTAKLQDQCVAKPEPYEERKQRRENEINGLKEALAALDGSKQMQVGSSTSVNTVFLQLRGSVSQAANRLGSLSHMR
ncbi:unnamed protein product [Symbiodinium sp. CCMP2592]|nr:unnamed protein product [Symbiodinium sp. CCMP2592]